MRGVSAGEAGVEALLLREVEPLLTTTLVLLDGGVPKDSSLSLDVVLLADSSLLLGGEVELPKNSSRHFLLCLHA